MRLVSETRPTWKNCGNLFLEMLTFVESIFRIATSETHKLAAWRQVYQVLDCSRQP